MMRKSLLSTMLGVFVVVGLIAPSAANDEKAQRQINRAIRKYHRLVEADKLAQARQLAERTAKAYTHHPAAKLLGQHSQLLVKSSAETPKLIQPTDRAQRDQTDEELIICDTLIVEVPDYFFEQLGMDFDFSKPEEALEPKPVTEVPPRPDVVEPPKVKLTSPENYAFHAKLSPLAKHLLSRAVGAAHGKVISHPKIHTINGQEAEVRVGQLIPHPNRSKRPTNSNFPIDVEAEFRGVGVKFTGTVTPDGKHFSLEIEGENLGEISKVETKLPFGETLLVDLGGHVVEAQSEQGVPVLDKIPHVNRLFKNVGIARETRRRLVFLTPRLGTESE